jgi:hypothetical protein
MKIPLEAEDRCIDSDPHASMPCGSQASS